VGDLVLVSHPVIMVFLMFVAFAGVFFLSYQQSMVHFDDIVTLLSVCCRSIIFGSLCMFVTVVVGSRVL
jgi:hypothetical protein